MLIVVVSIVLIFVFVSLAWMYLISIYELKYVPSSPSLVTGGNSELSIDVIPLNSFGKKALFRTAQADFFVEEGEDLIDILSASRNTARFKIRSRESEGEVVILIKSKKSLLPIKIVIPIYQKNKDNYL
jgi:hypothetical protein